jgi:hypothetical protein
MFEPQMFEPTDQSFVEGSPEVEIAFDMVRRALPVAPVLVIVSGLIWGWPGAASSAYGLAIVLVNFLLAASLMAWAARISPTMLMAATLGGFLLRMVLIVVAVSLVHHASWAVMIPMLFTILIAHVGLLIWETRYVSISLAYPGLKPRKGA